MQDQIQRFQELARKIEGAARNTDDFIYFELRVTAHHIHLFINNEIEDMPDEFTGEREWSVSNVGRANDFIQEVFAAQLSESHSV